LIFSSSDKFNAYEIAFDRGIGLIGRVREIIVKNIELTELAKFKLL